MAPFGDVATFCDGAGCAGIKTRAPAVRRQAAKIRRAPVSQRLGRLPAAAINGICGKCAASGPQFRRSTGGNFNENAGSRNSFETTSVLPALPHCCCCIMILFHRRSADAVFLDNRSSRFLQFGIGAIKVGNDLGVAKIHCRGSRRWSCPAFRPGTRHISVRRYRPYHAESQVRHRSREQIAGRFEAVSVFLNLFADGNQPSHDDAIMPISGAGARGPRQTAWIGSGWRDRAVASGGPCSASDRLRGWVRAAENTCTCSRDSSTSLRKQSAAYGRRQCSSGICLRAAAAAVGCGLDKSDSFRG